MKHVLAARLDNDGDVLLTGPAIRALAAGGDRVTLLCGPRGRQAADLLPGVDDVIEFRAPWIDSHPEPVDRDEITELVARLRSLAIDDAVVFTSFHQCALPLALLLRLAGVRTIAAISDEYPGSLLDIRHGVPDDLHEVERALSLAAALGYLLPRDDDVRLHIVRRAVPLRLGDRPYVVVHPGASAPARTWEPARWAALVRSLADAGRRVVVTGSPGERDLTAAVADGDDADVVDLGGVTEYAELAEVLAEASVVCIGNTGPAHLAAAVATPVVSLFAPTVPAVRWRPWGVPNVVLGRQDIPCAGCRARVCPYEGHPCLGDVGLEEVVEAVELLAPLREAVPA